MSEKGAQQILPVLHGIRCASGAMSEDVKVDDGIVGQRVGFEIGPQVFDGIEVGGVRRHIFQMCRTGQDAFVEQFAFVGLEAVPDEHDWRSQLHCRCYEESHGALGIDVGVRMQSEVQHETVTRGRNAQRGDGGDLLMAAATLSQYRCLATHAPGATHQGRHEHPGFIEEHERRSQTRGVFFTRGQSCSIQARIRCSSRSTARRVGFWGEKPRPCRRRLTCAG